MKILDRYILKNLLLAFFYSLFLFTFISVVIDISEKTDDFVKSGLTTSQIISEYYIGFVPHILALLFPLFVFLATIFFTSKLAGQSEIIAILASGTSFNRFLLPFLLAGIILATTLWFGSRLVIPKANAIRVSFQANYIDKNSTYNPLVANRNSIYLQIAASTYASISYDTATKKGVNFFVQHVKNNKVDFNLRAETIQWDSAKQNWVLENVIERNIDGLKETVLMIPKKTMNYNFKPLDLKRDEYTKDMLNTADLDRFIDMEEQRGVEGLNALKVERHRRDATPASVILLTMIGALVASRKVRGGSGVHLAIGFIAVGIYILADKFSTIFSTKGNFPPVLAAWTPNLIFLFVAFWFYRKTPK